MEVVLNKDFDKDKVKVFIRNVPSGRHYYSGFKIYPLDGWCGIVKGEIVVSYDDKSIFSSGFSAPNLNFFVAGNELGYVSGRDNVNMVQYENYHHEDNAYLSPDANKLYLGDPTNKEFHNIYSNQENYLEAKPSYINSVNNMKLTTQAFTKVQSICKQEKLGDKLINAFEQKLLKSIPNTKPTAKRQNKTSKELDKENIIKDIENILGNKKSMKNIDWV